MNSGNVPSTWEAGRRGGHRRRLDGSEKWRQHFDHSSIGPCSRDRETAPWSQEVFFLRDRGAEVFHEVSPVADPSLLTLLNERGYQPVELTSVLIRPTAASIDPVQPRDERIVVRGIDPGESSLQELGPRGVTSFERTTINRQARRRGPRGKLSTEDRRRIAPAQLVRPEHELRQRDARGRRARAGARIPQSLPIVLERRRRAAGPLDPGNQGGANS